MKSRTTNRRGADRGGTDRGAGGYHERAVVVIDTEAELTLVPLGVMVPGLTEHTESAGAPLHDSITG